MKNIQKNGVNFEAANLQFEQSQIKQRLIELKRRAEIKHTYWKPEVGETIAGQIMSFDHPLIIKTADEQIIKIYFDSMDSPLTNRDDEYLVNEGDLIAVTYNGEKPPYGVKKYSVLIDKVVR